MYIRLDRKKLLFVTFFLCCLLPSGFTWFRLESAPTEVTGLMLIDRAILLSFAVYAFALLFQRFGHVLGIGITAHILLLCATVWCLPAFSLWAQASTAPDISFSLAAATPLYWVSAALQVVHLALFTTTEIAVQRLSGKKKQAKRTQPPL